MLTVRGKGCWRSVKSPFLWARDREGTESGDCRDPKAKKAEGGNERFSLALQRFARSVSPQRGSREQGVWERACGSPGTRPCRGRCAERVCEPSTSPPAVRAGAGLLVLVPWCLLSLGLAFLPARHSGEEVQLSAPRFKATQKIAWLPPGVRPKESLSFDLKLGRVCCPCHRHSLLLSASRVFTWEAQGTDWLAYSPRRSWRRWLAPLNCFRDVCGGGRGRGGGGKVQNGSRGQRKVSPGKRVSRDGEGPYFPSPAQRSCLWISPIKNLFLPPWLLLGISRGQQSQS